MIRLYLNRYRTGDVEILTELFEDTQKRFLTEYCKDYCVNCAHSKICRDIEKALNHLVYEYESR